MEDKHGTPWSKEEIKFLKEFYPKHGCKYCAEKLNRHDVGVRSKAYKLGLKWGGIRYKYSKENLEPIVKKSYCMRDVLTSLGHAAAGGNHALLKKYIELHQIDTSHFDPHKIQREQIKRFHKQIPLSDILVENSSYSRSALKERLYKEGLKERKCEIKGCGQGEEWMGKKMSLILDHVNGVNNDNRIENLRIVCPNCNSTLPTHCGKQNKKIHYCECGNEMYRTSKSCKSCRKSDLPKENFCACGKQIRRRSTMCSKCANSRGCESRRKVKNRPPVSQLKKELEELGSYRALGKKYGVSDVAVHKWVKKG